MTNVKAWRGYAILQFGTSWCEHCQIAEPVVNRVLVDYAALPHIKIADGKGKILGRKFRVKLWPTLILLQHGQEIARIVRPTCDNDILDLLAELT